MKESIKINRMPAITWHHLRINERTVEFVTGGETVAPVVICPDSYIQKNDYKAFEKIEGGAGSRFAELIKGYDPVTWYLPEGTEETSPVRVKYSLEDGENTFNRLGMELGKDSKGTLIIDCLSEREAEGYAAFQTKAVLRENATLTLVQVCRLGSGYHCIHDIGVFCEDNARVNIIQVIFSGKENDIGCNVVLSGDKASLDSQIAYVAKQKHVVDLTYNVIQEGKKTDSTITASGVLRDESKKTFRGTIDFKPGCSGSKGAEQENVLLMDDGVGNKTVPVILCAEEDVEGEHGATIGKLDDELIYYLETRGIPYENIYEMMAHSRLETVYRRIPCEETVEELSEFAAAESWND